MASYVRQSIWDFLLVALCSIALSYLVLRGFNVDPALQSSLIPAAITAAFALLLFIVGANKRWVLFGGIAYAVIVVVGAVISAVMTQVYLIADEEGNYLIFFLVVSLVPTAVFGMSRVRAGTAALLIIGIFTCGFVEFFWGFNDLVWTLTFLVTSLALIIYKNYQLSARTATTIRGVSFPAGFGVALGTVAVVVGLGAVVWFAIIAPLNPGVWDLKLITEERSLETIEVHGTSEEYLSPDTSLTSKKTNDQSRTTDDLQRGNEGIETPAQPLSTQNIRIEAAGTFLGIDLNSLEDVFDFQGDPTPPFYLWLLLFLIPLAIAAYFFGRRIRRNMRLDNIRKSPPAAQMTALYVFLLDRLGRVGYGLPDGATPTEYAANSRNAMTRFDDAAGVSFAELTGVYTGMAYGEEAVTQEQADDFAAYYQGFWKAARRQLGNFRYFFRSFRL